MADRWAALAYGSAAFEQGLHHVITRSVEFPQFATASIDDDDREAWSLFADRDSVEREMTEVVRHNVRQRRGIDIAHL